MKRRKFITLLTGAGAATVLSPLTARAQQSTLPVVGFVSLGSADTKTMRDRMEAFRKGLGEAGYVEGRNVQVEYHLLGREYGRAPSVLEDLIRRRVAVIAIPGSTPISLTAKKATTAVPIVFAVGENPMGLGLVESLARPGGNATGINFLGIETDAKRLGLMHELLPKATRFAALLNPSNARYSETTRKALVEAARSLGVEISFFNASTPDEIVSAFAAMARERAGALFIATEGFFASRGAQLAALATRFRLPTSFVSREQVQSGLLMSYGASWIDILRQVGFYSGRILKGTKPADLPVMQATKFELVINMKTARTLGIEIPPMLLARADEVID